MTKSKDKFTVEIVSGLQSITTARPLRPTTFIEDEDGTYPYAYCALPENFFDFALSQDPMNKETTLLAIDSWDGREILSVIRKQ